MAKLIYASNMSLDGCTEDERGAFDWAPPAVHLTCHPQPGVAQHYMRTERRTIDERPYLQNITKPVLVMAGELDPMCPIETSKEIVDALPAALVRFERFAECGHGVFRDDPDRAFAVLRDFISA